MNTIFRSRWFWTMALVTLAASMPATAMELHAVEFPERRSLRLDFNPAPGAPQAGVEAEVLYRDGQARIDITYESMKPAVLYGGDVTCYVLWAVTLSGRTENLGELIVREPKGRLDFATANKNFALLVTAEPFYLVDRPSKLVVFASGPYKTKRETSIPFTFGGFGPAPDHAMRSIRQIAWDSDDPLELLQARKAHEVATRRGAATHASRVFAEATAALEAANTIAKKSRRSRELLDHSRRSVALSNEAINLTMHRLEAVELESRLTERRREMERIEQRASEAETLAEEARVAADAARLAADAARREQQRLSAEIDELVVNRNRLESSLVELQGKAERLAVEKQQLSRQLESALSHVAETRRSARGLVVNLPDILFDVNQATLKSDTRIVLAKLAGILLIMPDLSARVEGHTDSTGSAEYNLGLSDRRARSVLEFLETNGVDPSRLAAEGFGMDQPVADNATADGRAKNRRVEIIIGEESGTARASTRTRSGS